MLAAGVDPRQSAGAWTLHLGCWSGGTALAFHNGERPLEMRRGAVPAKQKRSLTARARKQAPLVCSGDLVLLVETVCPS